MRVKIYIWLKCNVYAPRKNSNYGKVSGNLIVRQCSALFKEQEKNLCGLWQQLKELEFEVHWDVIRHYILAG